MYVSTLCMCMYVCMYAGMKGSKAQRLKFHDHAHVGVRCVYVCMYVCVYIYIYIYMYVWKAQRLKGSKAQASFGEAKSFVI